jgi:hypothetical protein
MAKAGNLFKRHIGELGEVLMEAKKAGMASGLTVEVLVHVYCACIVAEAIRNSVEDESA